MFINSIFLPKNLPNQTLPEGMLGKIGDFSHLFSNVFKIIKDGQENLNPIQIFQQIDTAQENVQGELLKISLLSDNKPIQENSSIPKIVELFLSQIKAGEYQTELADSNKVKVNEKAPKYFSLSKEDFAKEIKNIINSLKNNSQSQSEKIDISIVTPGVSIPIDLSVKSINEIVEIVSDQLQVNTDFKIVVQRGNQKLTLDIEPPKSGNNKSYIPEGIAKSNNDLQSNEKIEPEKAFEQVKTVENNQTMGATQIEKKINIKSPDQPQLQGLKSILSVSEDRNEINVNPALLSENNQTQKKNITSVINQLNLVKPDIGNQNNEIQIPELSEPAISKNEFSTGALQYKEVATPEKNNEVLKSSVSNQSGQPQKNSEIKITRILNSFPLSKISSADKKELNEVAEKTEVKEIKIFSQTAAKNISTAKNIETKTDTANVFQKPFEQKPVGQPEKIISEKPVNQVNSAVKNLTDTKEPDTEPQSEILQAKDKALFKADTNTPVKQENLISVKTGTIVYKPEKQELSIEGKVEIIDTKTVPAKTMVSGKSTEIEIPKPVDSESINKNDVEVKVQSKTEISDWFRNKIIDYQKTGVKENKPAISNPAKENIVLKTPVKEKIVEVITDVDQDDITTEKNGENQFQLKQIKNTPNKILNPSEDFAGKEKFVQKENLQEITKPEDQLSEKKPGNINPNFETKLKKENETGRETETKLNPVKDNKEVKIDFNERRVFSRIPKIEVIADDNPKNSSEQQKVSSEPGLKEKFRVEDSSPIKPVQDYTTAKQKDEKHVWVKVSVEKTEVENFQETKKNVSSGTITINVEDENKKDFSGRDYQQDEKKENPGSKSHNVSNESSQPTENKTSLHTQNNNTNQQEVISSVKPEHKTEQSHFKTELHNENIKSNSRAAELSEKIKVISSGEMVREVYKVLENGEKQSVILKLVPKELGAIKVLLDTIDNVVTAKVEVENESVGQVIRNNVEQLKQNLAQSGVNVGSINISYHSPEHKQQGFNNQKKKNQSFFRNNEPQEIEENIVTKKLGYNTYEYLA